MAAASSAEAERKIFQMIFLNEINLHLSIQ